LEPARLRLARAIERATGQPVGVMSANRVGEGRPGVDPEDHDIGWWLDPVAWGRGLAREGAGCALRGALRGRWRGERRRVPQPANAASIAVAETIGLRHAAMTTERLARRSRCTG
jgi:RimJ/RimL family protein N-acetyltransferase